VSTNYDWLDDPAEREFLTNVDPAEVAANAHRAYDWLTERGIAPDSLIREEAFAKAAFALGIDYDVLYDAWLDRVPLLPEVAAHNADDAAFRALPYRACLECRQPVGNDTDDLCSAHTGVAKVSAPVTLEGSETAAVIEALGHYRDLLKAEGKTASAYEAALAKVCRFVSPASDTIVLSAP
jgi:hypothetical protein